MNILVFDLETNGFTPNVIFVLGILDHDTQEFTAYTEEDGNIAEGLLRLQEADVVAAHNGNNFDIPVIERLTEGLVKFEPHKVIDTCELSRKFFPNLPNHKLRTFGELFGAHKGDWTNFDKFDRGMIPYCKQDCVIASMLLTALVEEASIQASEGRD